MQIDPNLPPEKSWGLFLVASSIALLSTRRHAFPQSRKTVYGKMRVMEDGRTGKWRKTKVNQRSPAAVRQLLCIEIHNAWIPSANIRAKLILKQMCMTTTKFILNIPPTKNKHLSLDVNRIKGHASSSSLPTCLRACAEMQIATNMSIQHMPSRILAVCKVFKRVNNLAWEGVHVSGI